MHEELADKGFQLLAFPCNQFFSQENGTHAEILEFVRNRFGVKFRLFEKIDVNGPNTHPVYQFLRNNSELFNKNTKVSTQIPWNFAKFLLDRNGKVVKFYKPNDELASIRLAIEQLLK